MKKILTMGLLLLSFNVIANTQNTTNKNVTNKGGASTENVEIKKFKTLKEAADNYSKVLQEVSNFGSREMLKSVNVEIDRYVIEKNDPVTKEKWDSINNMLLEQFEVSVHKVNEYGNLGDVIFLIKAYDEKAMEKYLSDNVNAYTTFISEDGNEVEIDIDKYIDIQYEYLKSTSKVNLATSTVNFVKNNNEWKVVEDDKK